MAALLRLGAARRLGGSMVQRAQAAVADRLGPRLAHTDESVHKEVMLEIQQKKEELYDVLSKAETDYMVTSWSNRRLLQNLSVQVAPRPYDRKWFRLRIVKKVNNFVEAAALVSLSGVMSIGLLVLDWPPAKKEKVPQPVLATKSNAKKVKIRRPVLLRKSSAEKEKVPGAC